MRAIYLLLGFFGNLLYLAYMTFVERDDFDFEVLPFGKHPKISN